MYLIIPTTLVYILFVLLSIPTSASTHSIVFFFILRNPANTPQTPSTVGTYNIHVPYTYINKSRMQAQMVFVSRTLGKARA